MPVFRIIIKKDSQTYTTYTYNSGINVFDDHIINTTIQTRKNGIPQRSTAIDFYHKDLRLIDSYLLENVSVHFKKVAGEGMFIGSQASFVEIPRVVIYRLIKLP